MDFKIIETSVLLPDVLLYRDRNENGEEVVKILAIGKVEGEEDMFASEEVCFEDAKSAINFIKDYSEQSANWWCEKQGVLYS